MIFSILLYKLFDIYINIQLSVINFINETPIIFCILCNIEDYLKNTIQYFNKILNRIREEPKETSWICACYMNRISGRLDQLDESYNYKYNEIYGNIEQVKYVKHRGYNEMIYESLSIPIFIFKFENNYTYRILFDEYEYRNKNNNAELLDNVDDIVLETETEIETETEYETDMDTDKETETDTDTDKESEIYCKETDIDLSLMVDFIKSNVRFLSIEYTHPMMANPIVLQLPQNMYIVGSQILSSVFIVRLLEYTVGENYCFDMNYKVNILDNNIQLFSLLSHQYIELFENDYKIMEVMN